MVVILLAPLDEQPRRLAEADAQSRRQRAGADAAFLAAAVEQRIERDPVADPERADALGAVDLVGGDGDQVAGVERERHAAEALDGVAEEAARRARGRCAAISATGWITPISLLTSIAATRPVRVVDRGSRRRSRSTRPSAPTGRISTSKPCAAEPFDRVEHAGMLGGEGDDPAPVLGQPRSGALQRPVGRLGRARGEIELARRSPSPSARRDLLPRHLDRRGRLAAEPVGLCGLANLSSSQGRIAAAASGASGVVA